MAKNQKNTSHQAGKFGTQHNRCNSAGRPRAYLRKFGICRICFRELAYKGQIPVWQGKL